MKSELKDLLAPFAQCKMIPLGSFEHTLFVYDESGKPFLRSEIGEVADAAYPAPMFQEILNVLPFPLTYGQGNIGEQRITCQFCDKYLQENAPYMANLPGMALKLWFKYMAVHK